MTTFKTCRWDFLACYTRIQFICTGCITDQKISSTCFKDCHTNTGCITGQKISSTCFKGCHTNTGCITGQKICRWDFLVCYTASANKLYSFLLYTYIRDLFCNVKKFETTVIFYWKESTTTYAISVYHH
jgi:hypothetical protein